MNDLKKLGLTQYEIDVYRTLLKEGTLTGAQVSKLSKVPHGKTYESLVKLEAKGLVNVTKTKPKQYTAVSPKSSIQHLVTDQIEYLQTLKLSAIEELEELKSSRPSKDEIREKISLLAGKMTVFPIVINMYETAKKEMKEIFTYELRPHSHIRAVNEASERGIKIKFLVTKKPTDLKMVRADKKAGVIIRYYPIDELRFVIKDMEESVQQIINPRDHRDRISIYIQSKALSEAINSYFEEIWKKAEPI